MLPVVTMEKQSVQTDETASYKEYPPSEIYTTSDPPPAYMKARQSSVVQVARIVAYTLVAVSFILGSFILASSYVTATLSCQEYQQYPQEYVEDRFPRFQGLVADPLESEETKHNHLESADHRRDDDDKAADQQQEESMTKEQHQEEKSKPDHLNQLDDMDEDEHELKFKLPIHLDLDALAGALLEGNSKSKMNCVVEKQKSEEVMNKDQRELITFGLDLAALDPGLKHVTGERLAIVCETSREAPKETQTNQIVLPFPLPGFHPMPQRMMPHPMPQQVPHFLQQQMPHPMHHQMPPRMPFNLPFFRPNPFQNFIPRPQPQSVNPRRNVEEIPILVLEDNDARLQNLVEIPRPAHPQGQNVLELNRINPQLQNIIDLARGASSLQNLIEIPETKAFPVVHPAAPEGRHHLPPWARPEIEEQVVQIQAIPAMMRPPQPPRTVQLESRPFHVESSIQVEGRPIQVEERPVGMEHRPMQMEQRPIQMEHRPIQMDQRPVHMEPRPLEARHPEGRSMNIEGRVLPVPSDTVNPPPPPFDMQPEPVRPHFVQPRSIRSADNVFHRRDKRERRCACDCAC